jgi:hypothetical protein
MAQLIKGGGSPIKLFYEGEGDTYKPVRGSSCHYNIMVQDPALRDFLISMFGMPDDLFRLEVYKNNELYWIGAVVNDFYVEQFNRLPFTAKIVAEDGLGRLKYIPFVDENGNRFIGRDTMVGIILKCLNKLNLQLPLITADSLYATLMTQDDPTDPLYEATVDMAVFEDHDGNPLSCYDVLEQILKKKGITIRQAPAEIAGELLSPPIVPFVGQPCDDFETYSDGVPPGWERWGSFWLVSHTKFFRESDSQHYLRHRPVLSSLYSVRHGWRFIGYPESLPEYPWLEGQHDGIFPSTYKLEATFDIPTFNMSVAGHGFHRFGIFAQSINPLGTMNHHTVPGVWAEVRKVDSMSYNSASDDYLMRACRLYLGDHYTSKFRLTELADRPLRLQLLKDETYLQAKLFNASNNLIAQLTLPLPDPEDLDDPLWRFWTYSVNIDETGRIGTWNYGAQWGSQHADLHSICLYSEETVIPSPLPDFDDDLDFLLESDFDTPDSQQNIYEIELQAEGFDDGTP